jgi:hypothetical protein
LLLGIFDILNRLVIVRKNPAISSTTFVSIETNALLVYILSSRPFQTKIQRYSVYSEWIEPFFGHFEVRKKLKLQFVFKCNGRRLSCLSSISDAFEIYQAWEPIFKRTTNNENFLKCLIIVFLQYHVILWFCPAKIGQKSGHPIN